MDIVFLATLAGFVIAVGGLIVAFDRLGARR
jgi:hypothetical protein